MKLCGLEQELRVLFDGIQDCFYIYGGNLKKLLMNHKEQHNHTINILDLKCIIVESMEHLGNHMTFAISNTIMIGRAT